MKKFMSLLLTLVLSVTLSACSNSGQTTATSTPASTISITPSASAPASSLNISDFITAKEVSEISGKTAIVNNDFKPSSDKKIMSTNFLINGKDYFGYSFTFTLILDSDHAAYMYDYEYNIYKGRNEIKDVGNKTFFATENNFKQISILRNNRYYAVYLRISEGLPANSETLITNLANKLISNVESKLK